MYRKFFGLAEPPFNLTPDSRFLYLSRKHREALANLIYGIQERKGFITLTGEIGSGKTTLCRALVNELDPETTRLAVIFNSYLNEIELLQTINEDFGIPSDSSSKKDLISELNRFLLDENTSGHNVVLIIDEAQNLSVEVLEQIRMLSNLETETEKLIQIVLMGQPELLDQLAKPELEQLNQRISVRYHINPLDEDDVVYYIRHRLFVAKAQIEIDFSPSALKRIYEFTRGIPRKINVLCDRCLLAAYSKVTYAIDAAIVKEAINEIEGEKKPHKKIESKVSPGITVKIGSLVLLFTVLGLVIIVGILLGVNLAGREKVSAVNPLELPSDPPSKPTYLSNDEINPPKGNEIPENKVESIPAPLEEKKNQAPSQKKKKPQYLFDWQYDNNGICRVNDPAYAYPASIITWLRLWNIEVELDDFKELGAETIKRLDLTENEKLGLKKIILGPDLSQAMQYDLPLILTISGSAKNLSPALVLTRIEGISCAIADPIRGMRILKRDKIDGQLKECVVLYFDKLGLEKIVRGEESERVKTLQTFLMKKGYYKGDHTGIFDSKTNRAIGNFQRFHQIPATGELNEETILMLSTRMITMRPRLYSSGGED